jgi:cytochrome c oxidase assembly protein subunit 15
MSASKTLRTDKTQALRWYTKFVAASTLLLIFAGAMVTSTGSGLAVPDWPLSYGMLFPPMVGGIFYEHGHRMIAAAVGLLTVLQAIWLQRREPRRMVRRLGWVSVAAVIVQGLLGGLTVIFLLPPAISISHAALAEIFLCLNVSIAFFTSDWYEHHSRHGSITPSRIPGARMLLFAVFLQILLGALMRHLQAGLAIPDFPLSFGRILPEFSSTAVVVNFAHRAGALVVLLLFAVLTPAVARSTAPALRQIYGMALGILVAQIALGAFTVWSGKSPVITSVHVVTGAMLLATTMLFNLAAHAVHPGEVAEVIGVLPRGVTA